MKRVIPCILVIFLVADCSKKRGEQTSCVQQISESGQITVESLRAGAGEGFLDFPVGVSMAGFGGRRGGKSPYNSALGASAGFYNRLRVKALALSNGGETIVIVKTPLIFPTLYLYEKITEKLKSDYGLDLWNNIILTATHTHSGPARFWRLLEGFGSFGLDESSGEIFKRLVDSIVPVIASAVNSMEEARFGYGINSKFDPEDRINRDRRCEDDNVYTDLSNPDVYLRGDTYKTKDNSLVIIKVEKKNGEPLAVVVNFGMHATVFEDENFTEDAPGAVEFLVEDAFGRRGKKVLALFVQGAGGDVSPAGDFLGHSKTQQLEMIGKAAAEKVLALWDSITTTDRVPMEIVNQRVNISREDIGYSDNEFVDFEGNPFKLGAFGCGGNEGSPGVDCGKPETKLIDGSLPCLFNIESLITDEASLEGFQQFMQTRLSAARIGDLFIATLPGEPLSMLASDLENKAREIPGIKDVTTFGYAQDHQLYLSTEEEWWQGGYEAFMNIWGPKFGNFLVEKSLALLKQVTTPEKEDNSACEPEQMIYTPLDYTYVTPTSSSPEPSILTHPNTQYKRFEKVILEWNGGDSGVDFPVVTVEQEKAGGVFATVKGTDLRDYDNTRYYMVTRYRAIPSYASNRTATERQHIWRIEWEIPVDFPAGRYRLSVKGNYYKSGVTSEYTLTSQAFNIEPSDTLSISNISAEWIGSDYVKITFRAKYPPNPVISGKPDGYETEDNQISGFRIRDFLSGPLNPVVRNGIAIVSIYDSTSNECDTTIATYNPATENFEAYYFPVTSDCPDTTTPHVEIAKDGLIDLWGNTNGVKASYP